MAAILSGADELKELCLEIWIIAENCDVRIGMIPWIVAILKNLLH